MRAQLVWAFREALDPVNGDNMANVAKIGMALEKAQATYASKEFKAMMVCKELQDKLARKEIVVQQEPKV
jgi:hypothetical protein